MRSSSFSRFSKPSRKGLLKKRVILRPSFERPRNAGLAPPGRRTFKGKMVSFRSHSSLDTTSSCMFPWAAEGGQKAAMLVILDGQDGRLAFHSARAADPRRPPGRGAGRAGGAGGGAGRGQVAGGAFFYELGYALEPRLHPPAAGQLRRCFCSASLMPRRSGVARHRPRLGRAAQARMGCRGLWRALSAVKEAYRRGRHLSGEFKFPRRLRLRGRSARSV